MSQYDRLAAAFGEVLREAREKAGLTQEALSSCAAVDRTFVGLIERGIRQPSVTTLWKLAVALQIRPSVLLTRVERLLRG